MERKSIYDIGKKKKKAKSFINRIIGNYILKMEDVAMDYIKEGNYDYTLNRYQSSAIYYKYGAETFEEIEKIEEATDAWYRYLKVLLKLNHIELAKEILETKLIEYTLRKGEYGKVGKLYLEFLNEMKEESISGEERRKYLDKAIGYFEAAGNYKSTILITALELKAKSLIESEQFIEAAKTYSRIGKNIDHPVELNKVYVYESLCFIAGGDIGMGKIVYKLLEKTEKKRNTLNIMCKSIIEGVEEQDIEKLLDAILGYDNMVSLDNHIIMVLNEIKRNIKSIEDTIEDDIDII